MSESNVVSDKVRSTKNYKSIVIENNVYVLSADKVLYIKDFS